ncbi:phage tail assembly chaperone [Parvibaculum sedimenti]|uniref:Phage tail assembly chaperone n=1 Tax=Parvibaculum sedimenti TaxID=2608632 RepID=A0A6N6VNX7_9HYPH|nr:phage tail assembly chaperone [Parvibaculum sedimenti]KAB7741600.1 phage tail assembly chaperone [Parvibaculum sedimenti]
MKTFPWTRAMEIGFGHLRLAPEQFWGMTLPELASAARCLRRDDGDQMTMRDLDRLMGLFPD